MRLQLPVWCVNFGRIFEKMILTSTFSSTEIDIDGDLEKSAWKAAAKVTFDQDAFQRTRYPEIATSVASRWTREHLYLAYWSKFTELNFFEGEDPLAKRWQLWERDVVEAFIAPQPEPRGHYYEFEVAPNSQWLDLEIDLDKQLHDGQWNSGFAHAARIDAQQRLWTVEMRIPARSMNVAFIAPNAEWRINLYRAEGFGQTPSGACLVGVRCRWPISPFISRIPSAC